MRLRAPIPNAVTPEQQRAVTDFVRGGKGVIVTHAGLDANYGWDDYREMVGGGLFESHPWTTHLRVTNEAKSNPATAHMDEQFWIREEFYILDRSPRATSQVLLSLDNTSLGAPNMGRLPAPGHDDHPVSWLRTYGQGRVFATILALPRHVAAARVRAAPRHGDAHGGGAHTRRPGDALVIPLRADRRTTPRE